MSKLSMYFGSISYGLSYGHERISFYYVPRSDAKCIVNAKRYSVADMRIL